MTTTSNINSLDVFDYHYLKEGLISLINNNTISENKALDLLGKLRDIYELQRAQTECCEHDYESGCPCCSGECKNCEVK
jgi:hypothetical protein